MLARSAGSGNPLSGARVISYAFLPELRQIGAALWTEELKVGVLGATGAVGQRLGRMLDGHPWFQVAAMAGSARTEGKIYGETLRPTTYAPPLTPELRDMTLLPSSPELVPRLPGSVQRPSDRCRPRTRTCHGPRRTWRRLQRQHPPSPG